VEVAASLSQGRTAAAQCGLFTHKSVPVIFEPPCRKYPTIYMGRNNKQNNTKTQNTQNRKQNIKDNKIKIKRIK